MYDIFMSIYIYCLQQIHLFNLVFHNLNLAYTTFGLKLFIIRFIHWHEPNYLDWWYVLRLLRANAAKILSATLVSNFALFVDLVSYSWILIVFVIHYTIISCQNDSMLFNESVTVYVRSTVTSASAATAFDSSASLSDPARNTNA